MTQITPFAIDIPDAELTDLKVRLEGTRWARPDPAGDWSRGVPRPYLEGLASYWGKDFDWRRQLFDCAVSGVKRGSLHSSSFFDWFDVAAISTSKSNKSPIG